MKNTIRIDSGNVKMVAHRGLSGIELENTASAFVAAGNRSYFGIETDVHRTADGQFVVFHDDNTRRIGGDSMVIEETTYETLRSLRLLDKDGKRGRNDLRIASLPEYTQICKEYGKISVLELKNHFEPADIDRIIALIREEGWLEETIFISFDITNLVYLRSVLPEQKAQFLAGVNDLTDEVMAVVRENRLDLDLYFQGVTKEFVDGLHAEGIELNVWTVDDPEAAAQLVECGVDYITSNILE